MSTLIAKYDADRDVVVIGNSDMVINHKGGITCYAIQKPYAFYLQNTPFTFYPITQTFKMDVTDLWGKVHKIYCTPSEVYYGIKNGIPKPSLSNYELDGIIANAMIYLRGTMVYVTESSVLGAIIRKLIEAGAWKDNMGFTPLMFHTNVTSRTCAFLAEDCLWHVEFVKDGDHINVSPPLPTK